LSVSGPRYRLEAAGEAALLPALFKHAKELCKTFGGNPDDPTFSGWAQTKGTGRQRRAAAQSTARRVRA